MLSVSSRIQIPLQEFEMTFARSGGPGGQNVNKVNSKAVLRWQLIASPSLPDDVRARFVEKYGSRLTSEGELILTSQKYRDQLSNVQDCYNKLLVMLQEVKDRPIQRRATRPTLGSQLRRVDSKRENSKKKQQRRSPQMGD
jgi:ribosome-associated protein